MKIQFKHQQSSHCESGVAANLFTYYNQPISEAMAFGIGEGLFFGYLPFIKVNGLPLTTFRCRLGAILNRTFRRLNGRLEWRKFRNPHKAMAALDEQLAKGIPVGCRTGAYWLPYFPPAFRFHFNMHNLVVYGKEEDTYLISDPVFSEPVICSYADLMKARFAQGPMRPKGRMFYIKQVPAIGDMAPVICRAIKGVCRTMLNTPGPLIGIRGVRFLANRLEKWHHKLGTHKAVIYIGHLIRMQEEIGTGGAGFRFMYAAFLQEAGMLLGNQTLLQLSEEMTKVGDQWRTFAVHGSRICKERSVGDDPFADMAAILRNCAAGEEHVYRQLTNLLKQKLI